MLGKYSPTVDSAYYKNQDWFKKYSNNNIYDPEGYDSYGYNKDGVDRAGNKELDYTQVCKCCGQTAPFFITPYMDVVEQWSYDGIKPIKV